VTVGASDPLLVPFVDLSRLVARVRGDVLARWAECLDACAFVGGTGVATFEGKVAEALRVPRVVACASGTDALRVALEAAGVRRGMKVALPNLTFWATFEAIVQLGATPVLIDIDPDDLQMSLDELRSAHDAYRLDAAVLVHLYGWTTARLHELRRFCEAAGVALVEDGAQCFGVEVSGEPLLARAALATLSFYPTKVVGGAMDGGALTMRSEEHEAFARSACNHGRSGHYSHRSVGWNSRMGGLQAAFLSRVLDELPEILRSRRDTASFYRARLADERRIKVFGPPHGVVENGYLSVITIEGKTAGEVCAGLRRAGIGSARTYPETIDAQPPARASSAVAHGSLRWSRLFCESVVNLPLFYGIREDEREASARAVLAIAGGRAP
jgi:dTDP-4-amino-4,6-dideoxygalactose transaminase